MNIGQAAGLVFSLQLLLSSSAQAQCEWKSANLPGPDGTLLSFTTWDPDGAGPQVAVVVAGGTFRNAGNVPANDIATWNPDAGWSGLGTGTNRSVRALTVFNGDLIAGGDFTVAGGGNANYIAKWNGTTFSALGGGITAGVGVRALVVYNGELIVGGDFTKAGEISANNIAKWNPDAGWSGLGSGMDSSVHALAVYNGELIAGGRFTTAGGISASNIARWNGTSWSPLGSGISGVSNCIDCPSSVDALTVYNGALIAGGLFTTAGGVSANGIAQWNGSNFSPLGDIVFAGLSGVQALTVYNGELYAGGDFTVDDVGDVNRNALARWNGTSWSPLGSGISSCDADANCFAGGFVSALTPYNGELIVGGGFTNASGNASANFARWACVVPSGTGGETGTGPSAGGGSSGSGESSDSSGSDASGGSSGPSGLCGTIGPATLSWTAMGLFCLKIAGSRGRRRRI